MVYGTRDSSLDRCQGGPRTDRLDHAAVVRPSCGRSALRRTGRPDRLTRPSRASTAAMPRKLCPAPASLLARAIVACSRRTGTRWTLSAARAKPYVTEPTRSPLSCFAWSAALVRARSRSRSYSAAPSIDPAHEPVRRRVAVASSVGGDDACADASRGPIDAGSKDDVARDAVALGDHEDARAVLANARQRSGKAAALRKRCHAANATVDVPGDDARALTGAAHASMAARWAWRLTLLVLADTDLCDRHTCIPIRGKLDHRRQDGARPPHRRKRRRQMMGAQEAGEHGGKTSGRSVRSSRGTHSADWGGTKRGADRRAKQGGEEGGSPRPGNARPPCALEDADAKARARRQRTHSRRAGRVVHVHRQPYPCHSRDDERFELRRSRDSSSRSWRRKHAALRGCLQEEQMRALREVDGPMSVAARVDALPAPTAAAAPGVGDVHGGTTALGIEDGRGVAEAPATALAEPGADLASVVAPSFGPGKGDAEEPQRARAKLPPVDATVAPVVLDESSARGLAPPSSIPERAEAGAAGALGVQRSSGGTSPRSAWSEEERLHGGPAGAGEGRARAPRRRRAATGNARHPRCPQHPIPPFPSAR